MNRRLTILWRSDRVQIAVEIVCLAAVCLAAGIAIGAEICTRVCTQ